jgi:DNA polymerase-1
MSKNMKQERLLLIDGSNYAARGFHAVKGLSSKSGFPTNAIKGMLAIIIADLHVLQPDYVIIAFDLHGKKNWRQIAYPMYKKSPARLAAREKAKAEGSLMGIQMDPLREILKATGLKVCCIEGEEADDIIGTIAVQYAEQDIEVVIASMDKDFAQLVNKNIKLMNQEREIKGVRGVVAKFGVKPSQIIDYLTLQGDGVDNIPGVPKCGPGTAAKWLVEHKTLRGVVAAADTFTPVLKANFAAHKKNFKWTKPLVTIKTDVETSLDIESGRPRVPKYNRLKRLCLELDLKATHVQLVKALNRIHQ